MTGVRQDVVLLAEDWHSGTSTWSAQRREAYANDLGASTSLVATTARSNQTKTDKDSAQGLPPAGEGHCRYLAEGEDMKLRYALSADQTEVAALREVAGGCPEQTVTYELALHPE
ncbi:hypothetical protein [Streptomyces sp. x-45]|uniref:hypothetical protein n=1 Tax=Streptomyces sp. x-45 TaxID=2789281 RepID=UPI00398066D1